MLLAQLREDYTLHNDYVNLLPLIYGEARDCWIFQKKKKEDYLAQHG